MKKKSWTLLFLLTVFVFLLTGCSEADKSYNAGISSFVSGDYPAAIRSFKRSVSQGKTGGEVHSYLALASYYDGTEDAAAYLQSALEKGKDDPEVLKNAGILYLETGALQNAESVLTDAVEKSAKDPALLNEARGFLARCYYLEEKYEEAIEEYTLLVKSDYCVTAHDVLLGICYLKIDQFYAAEQYFKLLSEKEDVLPEYYILISDAFREKDEKKKANRYFEEGLKFCDLKERNTISAAEYYLAAGKFKKAESSYDLSDRFENRLLKAEVYIENGEYEKADAEYVALLSEGSDKMTVYLQQMKLKILTGDRDAVLQLLSVIKAEGSEDVKKDAAWNEIMMYELMLDYDTAFSKLRDYRKAYPNDSDSDDEYLFLSGVMKGY